MRNENEKCAGNNREHNNLNEQPTRFHLTPSACEEGGGCEGRLLGFQDEYKLPAEVTIN